MAPAFSAFASVAALAAGLSSGPAVAGAVASNAAAGTGALSVTSASAAGRKERPVMKVVRLLQDMQVELQRELDDDKAVHEKLSCWCSTNDQEKTKAIELGEAKSAQLSSDMDAATAKMIELKEKRANTLEEVDNDHAALTKASGLRMKENKAFQAEETDLLEAVAACKQAIVALSKHHPDLAQLRSVAQRLQNTRLQHLLPAAASTRSEQLELLRAFLQQAEGAQSFLAIPGFQSYRPQSGQIFGILKQMQEDFERSLSDAQQSEKKDKEDYAALKAAKEDEIAAGRKAIVQLDADLAEFGEKHAQAAKELEDTKDQLAMDTEFLAKLKEKCSESKTEFDARVKSRLEEIAAVEDTIGILNSDDSFDAFDKSVNTALLQIASSNQQEQALRARAVAVLRKAANGAETAQLALLAASAQLDAFEKVKAEIDKLVAELGKQMKDEVDQRDWCTDELASNGRATAAADDKKAALDTKIADETKTVEKLTADIDGATNAIADMQEQMKRASENREAESADNSRTVSDQRLTQMILQKAIDRMKQVYNFLQQEPGAAHIATSGTHTDPGNGPARFTKYEQNAGGARVLQMLEQVHTDSSKLEDEALAAENDAQSAYENFMKDSNKAIKKYSESITSMTEARATAKESLSMAKNDLKQTVEELGGLSETLGDLHKSCDFVLKNFEARQAARSAEMDALKDAKAILSGMH
eukprot:TRINITY_DN5419_c0_g2_i2.p1 TRINITY_DN5419_c0_g2~~TRINITY_DN5419_c0_g2_i2.p1  ORF type:complete len:704 (-),score=230.98 TRINITY_DN5419_c0_g2_i2:90-2201(-)